MKPVDIITLLENGTGDQPLVDIICLTADQHSALVHLAGWAIQSGDLPIEDDIDRAVYREMFETLRPTNVADHVDLDEEIEQLQDV